ncbi:MAG: lysophospholipid acyltransferase family protein [Gammaproteobacteria bacterium]|jgi:1-acyl-sn-glycerol-3-phosphate acyltransferase|nr:lysophospholipid acyltransferase family protein [Gammaproteobacteria bacterium]
MIFLRSLLFATGMWISVAIFAPLTLLTLPLSLERRYRFISQWARFNLWLLRLTCGLGFRVEGADRIPRGPAIVFCKHQSAWETLALQCVFPHQIWLLKRELLWIPFFGWGLALLDPIAIDRKSGRRAINHLVAEGRRHLDAGRWVIIFPEGTRVASGETGRYGIGGPALAEESGYPVVPVAHNAGQFWPRRGFLKRPGTVRMMIGPTIETHGKSAEEIRDEAKAWIEAATREIEGAEESENGKEGRGKR